MKIIKLPVEYIRFLNEENYVIYGRYEYWMFLKSHNGYGRRYIIASRLRYGSDTVEDVIVGFKYDIERLSQVYFGRVRPFDPLPRVVGRGRNHERLF